MFNIIAESPLLFKLYFTRIMRLSLKKFLPLLFLAPFVLSCADMEPNFMDPPDEYYLNVIRLEQSDTVFRTYILDYNDMGLVSNGTMEYDSSGNLIRSDWGGRPYFVNYEYSDGQLISAISGGHLCTDTSIIFSIPPKTA